VEDDQDVRILRLTDAGNTYNPVLSVIREKGYHIYFVPYPRGDVDGDWWAIKDRRDFIAIDPLRLLGLIALWEQRGDKWREHDTSDIYGQSYTIAFPKDDYDSLDDHAFDRLVDHLRILFEAYGTPLPDQLDKQGLAQLVRRLGEEAELDDSNE